MTYQDQTIQSLFEEALEFDEPYTAHFIYFATQKGKVSMQDKAANLFEITMSDAEVVDFERMKAQNPLKMRPIKLYAIRRTGSTYVFYFARDEWEVWKYHYKLYRSWETKIINAHNQMIDRCLYFPDTNETKTFRQLLKETVEFPRWVCELEGGSA